MVFMFSHNLKVIMFFLFILLTVFVILNHTVFAALDLRDAFGGASSGPLDTAANQAGYNILKYDPTSTIGIIIQATLSLLGVIFIILMIYGGGLWMTAKGNEQQVDKAKDLITAAIIGLIIVVAAYAISYFVIKTIGQSGLKI